jgi:AraC-like DNA-binding protein
MPLIAEASRDARWSTSDFSSDQAGSRWMELLSKSIATMHVDSLDRKPFSASRRRIGLGPIELNILEASSQRVQRTRSMISRQKPDYDLLYLQEGAGELEHCGNKIRVPTGSFVLLDNQQPYELLFPNGSVCLAIHFEDRWLRKWVPFPREIAAQAISGDFGWGTPLVAMLRVIFNTGLEGAVLSRSAIADQLGALLALMVGKGEAQFSSRHQADLLVRFKQAVRERYDEVDLDPASVARDMGVSRRHLHGVFAQGGTTFGAVLLDIRLTRAAEMLQNHQFRAYGIGDIAWACGFADPSHFARRFRQRYGTNPVRYRAPVELAPADCRFPVILSTSVAPA